MKSILIAVSVLVSVSICGCLFAGHDVEPRVPTAGMKIAVIPFRENNLYYLESRVGAEMATLVTQILVREAIDMKVLSAAAAEPLLKDRNPEKIDWGEVAKKLKADYVLTGHITLFRSKDAKKDFGFYRGEMVIQVKVWRSDNTMAIMETVKATHPSDRFGMPVVPEMDATEEEVLGHLKAQAAVKIGKFFYPHDVQDD